MLDKSLIPMYKEDRYSGRRISFYELMNYPPPMIMDPKAQSCQIATAHNNPSMEADII